MALQGATFDQLLQRISALDRNGSRCRVLQDFGTHTVHQSSSRSCGRGMGRWRGRQSNCWRRPRLAGRISALRTGKPVISNHLENEERFRTSELLKEHGIRRAMNVILQGDGKPYGVLEVDSRSGAEFFEHDLAFLQGAANLLGMAIERERHDRSLTAALEKHQVLLKEMNHRIKNSLAIVASLLNLQARDNANPGEVCTLTELNRCCMMLLRQTGAHHDSSVEVHSDRQGLCRSRPIQ